jgi:hypothetical protein
MNWRPLAIQTGFLLSIHTSTNFISHGQSCSKLFFYDVYSGNLELCLSLFICRGWNISRILRIIFYSFLRKKPTFFTESSLSWNMIQIIYLLTLLSL